MENKFISLPQADQNIKEEQKQGNTSIPMYHGKANDELIKGIGESFKNEYNGYGELEKATLEAGKVKLIIEEKEIQGVINNATGLINGIGVSTHKLLSLAIAEYTKNPQTRVYIPLKEYLKANGYDIEEKSTSTQEENKKELNRVENEIRNGRKKVRKDLNLLYSISLHIEEDNKSKKRGKDFLDSRLLSSKGISNGYIYISFTNEFTEYLKSLPITQYPIVLLKLDERNNNAYAIGYKMAEHYCIDNNQRTGNAQKLKVITLLKVTSLPTIEEIKKQRASWKKRIKEPLEKALNELVKIGLLKSWKYQSIFSNYEKWEKTVIYYELNEGTKEEIKEIDITLLNNT